MVTKPRNVVTINPLGPATERQKALMVTLGIPFEPGCTKKDAETLIDTRVDKRSPHRGNKPAKRRALHPGSRLRGYLTRAELAANIAKITESVSSQIMQRFLAEADKAYEAVALARDDLDPKVRGEALRAAIHHLDRIMGKPTETSINKNLNVNVEITEIEVRLPAG